MANQVQTVNTVSTSFFTKVEWFLQNSLGLQSPKLQLSMKTKRRPKRKLLNIKMLLGRLSKKLKMPFNLLPNKRLKKRDWLQKRRKPTRKLPH